jgi:hypothetical protein
MPLARAVADGLLERQVLLAPEQIERADWGFVVRATEHGVDRDAHAAFEGDGVRRVPAHLDHGVNDIRFRAHEGDVDWVAGMAVGGVRDVRSSGELGVFVDRGSPQQRSRQVRDRQIDE